MGDLTDSTLVNDGAIPPDSFWDAIDRTVEVAKHPLVVPEDLIIQLELEAADLLMDRDTLVEAAAGLIAGNLILQGPPGTGKSALAGALTRAFGVAAIQATAREDWTAFDVIGGQELTVSEDGVEALQPVHGWFTEAVIRCAGSVSRNLDDPELNSEQATWLVIDELNRANMDRAFGELFSVLGTDAPTPLTLRYMPAAGAKLTKSRRFRIIGTLNSFDKQFVNSLSLAIRRRFTFVTVDIPPKRAPGESWTTVIDANPSLAIRELEVILDRAFKNLEDLGGVGSRREEVRPYLARILEEVEKVRYAAESDAFPFLPIGTAPLIDVTVLALTRAGVDDEIDWMTSFDWACSVKLAPLFETDLGDPEKLRTFADAIRASFPRFSKELARIEAAGLYAVP